MKVMEKTIVIRAYGKIPKGLVKGLEDIKSETSRDQPDYSITKKGKNTEKSPGDLGRFAVVQFPMRNHRLMLV